MATHTKLESESLAEEAAEHEHHSMTPYLVVWIALLILTAVTYFSAKVNLGWANLPLALAIATTKAGLVVWYFMHLRDQRGLNRIVFAVSVFMVFLLMLFSVGDTMTRWTFTNPPLHQAQQGGESWTDQGVAPGAPDLKEGTAPGDTAPQGGH